MLSVRFPSGPLGRCGNGFLCSKQCVRSKTWFDRTPSTRPEPSPVVLEADWRSRTYPCGILGSFLVAQLGRSVSNSSTWPTTGAPTQSTFGRNMAPAPPRRIDKPAKPQRHNREALAIRQGCSPPGQSRITSFDFAPDCDHRYGSLLAGRPRIGGCGRGCSVRANLARSVKHEP